jgi:RNA-directed DNA polymerase
MAKSYQISQKMVYEADKKVKANQGAAGVDQETMEKFEEKLGRNLYKIGNRLSSGRYDPPPVKGVLIPKKSGGIRTLGIPTISDRVAQMVVKMTLEPILEPIFRRDSYGYRPHRSAIGAVGLVRKRSRQYDWVVEFDRKGLFDHLSHELLRKAVRKHSPNDWTTLDIESLKAPIKDSDGIIRERHSGTPQGGVISPLLANLFMHDAFDRWITHTMHSVRFVRYADDAVVHGESKSQ